MSLKPNVKKQKPSFLPVLEPSDSGGGELFGIDVFFVIRAAGWIGIGAFIILFTVLWGKVGGWNDFSFLITMSIIILSIMVLYAARLLYIGKSHRYFVLKLTCQEIYYPKLHEAPGAFFNPNSQTAFRSSQKVTFKTADDRMVIFTFDRGRKFMEGSRYAFYFAEPPSDEPITLDKLEHLKIDHTIIPQAIYPNDTN